MIAQIVTIGNELLLGRTIDTNASWLAERLDQSGFEVVRKTTVGDSIGAIEETVRRAIGESSVVVTTGGLGPTHDDISKKAIAKVFEVELQVDAELESRLADMYERRGRPFTPERRTMAAVPVGFDWVPNPVGSAPGLVKKMAEPDPKCLFVLPGVPKEMKAIFDMHADSVFAHVSRSASVHRTFRTAGIPENRLQRMLSDVLDDLPPEVDVAFLPDAINGVAVRLTARSGSAERSRSAVEETSRMLEAAIGKYVYGGESDRLENVVGQLLIHQRKTVSVAESCTGGLIADRFTDVPGSSAYMLGGVVAYANEAKSSLLGVDREVIESAGAVSKVVALQMADGCRDRFKSDLALSATGIAGPDGGTSEKPVGTVWIGISDAEKTVAFNLRLTENRRLNKELTSTAALNILRIRLGD